MIKKLDDSFALVRTYLVFLVGFYAIYSWLSGSLWWLLFVGIGVYALSSLIRLKVRKLEHDHRTSEAGYLFLSLSLTAYVAYYAGIGSFDPRSFLLGAGVIGLMFFFFSLFGSYFSEKNYIVAALFFVMMLVIQNKGSDFYYLVKGNEYILDLLAGAPALYLAKKLFAL